MSPFEIEKAVYDFYEDLSKYNRNHEFIETKYGRGNLNYERILKRLEKINLPDPLRFQFQVLRTREIKEYILEIMCKILGPEYKAQIEELNRLIRIAPIEEYFDSIVETTIEGDNHIPKTIYISNRCFSIQVASTSHEIIHCLQSPYMTDKFNSIMYNVHYNELLPIIIEYIVCYELSQILKEEDLENRHKIIRLDHGKKLVEERNESMLMDSKLRSAKNTDSNFMKKCIEYQEHSTFGYIISDIYSVYLLDIYKENREKIISIIKELISGQKSIKDLIDFFNLSLTNKDIISRYQENIDELSLTKKK